MNTDKNINFEKDGSWTKNGYLLFVKEAKKQGLCVQTKYRKGLKNIKIAPILLECEKD